MNFRPFCILVYARMYVYVNKLDKWVCDQVSIRSVPSLRCCCGCLFIEFLCNFVNWINYFNCVFSKHRRRPWRRRPINSGQRSSPLYATTPPCHTQFDKPNPIPKSSNVANVIARAFSILFYSLLPLSWHALQIVRLRCRNQQKQLLSHLPRLPIYTIYTLDPCTYVYGLAECGMQQSPCVPHP